MAIFRNDRALLDAFRAGDRAALRRVYDHYKRQVEQVITQGAFLGQGGRFPGAPRGECRDLIQETFLRAFAEPARLSFNGIDDYQPFLLGISRRILAEWWRKRGREVPTDDVLDLVPPLLPPTDPAFDRRELELTRRYLDSLPAALKAIHEQRYVQSCSQVETAEKLAITRQQVRTLELKLRRGLKKWLQKKSQPKSVPAAIGGRDE